MNTPGLLGQNWGWRFRAEAINERVAGDLRFLTALGDRLPSHLKAQDTGEGPEYEPAED
jgi:hypothetical protein